jgi:hypothetical protein
LRPVGPGTPPLFLFFPTITSHLPFGPVPPDQGDWERLLTPDPFGAAESQRLLTASVDWLDMLPNCVAMFDDTDRWPGGCLQRPEPRESMMLWVGDHQPAASVSGEGASWEVPVHVITPATPSCWQGSWPGASARAWRRSVRRWSACTN